MQHWLIVFDDAYRFGRKFSLSHRCAVLSHGDFAFHCSGNAISKWVMVSIVCQAPAHARGCSNGIFSP